LKGSKAERGGIHQGYHALVCATATAVNMVSANLKLDTDGRVNGQLSRLQVILTSCAPIILASIPTKITKPFGTVGAKFTDTSYLITPALHISAVSR